jgi:excisionase family DNA binding protein
MCKTVKERGTMPITRDGETYYTASEAADYLGISRPTFYQNVQPHIREYKFGALRRTYYSKTDLDRFRSAYEINGK